MIVACLTYSIWRQAGRNNTLPDFYPHDQSQVTLLSEFCSFSLSFQTYRATFFRRSLGGEKGVRICDYRSVLEYQLLHTLHRKGALKDNYGYRRSLNTNPAKTKMKKAVDC